MRRYLLTQGLHLCFKKLHVLFLHCCIAVGRKVLFEFGAVRYVFLYVRMDQIPPPEEKEDHRPPEDQGDNSLVIDEEKPNEGRIIFF